MAAMLGHPELMLDPARRSQTSYFERMQRDHADELAAGLERLERELRAGDGSARRRPATRACSRGSSRTC